MLSTVGNFRTLEHKSTTFKSITKQGYSNIHWTPACNVALHITRADEAIFYNKTDNDIHQLDGIGSCIKQWTRDDDQESEMIGTNSWQSTTGTDSKTTSILHIKQPQSTDHETWTTNSALSL